MLTAMPTRRRCGVTGAMIALLAATASSVSAQNYSLDARLIGIGGVGTSRNLSSKMVDEVDTYGVIGIPLGLLQLAGDTDMFNPSSDNFNPVRAIQFAANPVHYTFGRNDTSNGATLFVTDVINGDLNRATIEPLIVISRLADTKSTSGRGLLGPRGAVDSG